jgi:hypothetical protein
MSLWWLSFCDASKPKGQQFLGACLVSGGDTGDERQDFQIAIQTAWKLGCNPGGEVESLRVPETVERQIQAKWLGRLLTRQECEEFDNEPYGVS